MNKREKELDEMVKYGFDLAIRYAKLAIKFDKDPIKMMEEKLENWDKGE